MRLVLLAILLPALLAGPALTGSSAVDQTAAGAGSGTVSGYTASAITYEVDGETIAAVSFSLSPPGAVTVKARLAQGEPWTPCTVDAGVATCPVATDVADARDLDVVATG